MKSLKEMNPFAGYIQKMEKNYPDIKLNPVREVVNTFYIMRGLDGKPKNFYQGRYGYAKLAKEAKNLLEMCGNNLEDALWCLDKVKYKAEKGGWDWSISTCLKHDLGWGTK